jgi:uncharacterized membrane protein
MGDFDMTQYENEDRSAVPLAIGLGWFSVALGVAELVAPRKMARLVGVPPSDRTDAVLQGFGAREIATGLAILAQPGEAKWLWARVAGDALDLGTLGAAMGGERADRTRGACAAAAVMGATALDVLCAQRLSGSAHDRSQHVRVEHVLTINRSIEDVYRYWRDFQNFPNFMRHVESVEVLGNGRTRWRAKAPAGMSVQWEAETLLDRENEWIAWHSVEGSQIENSGSVRFHRAPGARGTEVRVQLEYHPPAGRLGRGVAWLFGEEPEQQVKDDLRRFKQLMETGEIPLSDGPALWRPAQPAADTATVRSLAGMPGGQP